MFGAVRTCVLPRCSMSVGGVFDCMSKQLFLDQTVVTYCFQI